MTVTSTSPLGAAPTVAGPLVTPVPTGIIAIQGDLQTLTSYRYGYRLSVPTSWVVEETPGGWAGSITRVEPRDAGMDWFSEPGVATIEVGFLALPAGTTVAGWEAAEAPAVRMYACRQAAKPTSVRIAGEPGLLLPEACPADVVGDFPGDQYFVNAFVVHGDTGVVIQWNSLRGHEAADRAAFLGIVRSLRFGTAG